MDFLLIDLAPLVSFSGGLHWTVGFLTTVAIFAIVALGLNLQWGYTGVFNFGIVAFFMVGAYTSALLTLPPPDPAFEDYLGGWNLPVPVGWLGGMCAAGLLAVIIGLPTLRLRRDFLAIATIGIARSCAAWRIPSKGWSTARAASTASPACSTNWPAARTTAG